MRRVKRILATLLIAAVFLTGGPYGAVFQVAVACANSAMVSATASCDQCSDGGVVPRCLSNALCGAACPQPPALPSSALAFQPTERVQLVSLVFYDLAGSVPRPETPPPRA